MNEHHASNCGDVYERVAVQRDDIRLETGSLLRGEARDRRFMSSFEKRDHAESWIMFSIHPLSSSLRHSRTHYHSIRE